MNYLISLVVLALLLGCASVSGSGKPSFITKLEQYPRYHLSPAEEKAVKDSVTAQLKDPLSAMFSPTVAAKEANGSILVCGNVDAQNSLGEYTGMKPFYVTLKNGAIANVTMAEDLERVHVIVDPCPDM
jgi:hypothetical protein